MIKNLILKYIHKIFAPNNKQNSDNISELLWANIYHDTIRNKRWLDNISISPYGMAINYSMLYVLSRVLNEIKPKSILEFGLGQSTKFINAFIDNELQDTTHHIIEHDSYWISEFKVGSSNFQKIIQLDLARTNIKNKNIQFYNGLLEEIDNQYDLFLIDGPNGLPSYSRYDICLIAEKFKENDQFIIIMDDFQRSGEKQTVEKLIKILVSKNIKFHSKIFVGSKSQFLLVTDEHKIALTF